MTHPDPFTQGAQDCRANNQDRSYAFSGHEQASYRHGWARAFQIACQRPDVAELFPQHFTQESPRAL
jgi:hypothetical protein